DHYRAWRLEGKGRPTPKEKPKPQPKTLPVSAERSLAMTHLREGFRMELVAAEPLVLDPVAIDWDGRGRLWVAEMADYPNGMDGEDKPGGRVRYLEDRDGDGRYEHSQLFAENLSFPNGVMAWRKGAIVTAAPEILYVADEDGDGRAERVEKLFTGFVPGNQQLRVNGPRWGLDNWIHAASGAHHANYGRDLKVRSSKSGVETWIGTGDMRFLPGTGVLERSSGPSQFGRVRDDWGRWFGVQNSRPLWHYVLDDRYLKRNPHVSPPDSKNQLRGVNPRLFPAKFPQKRFHSYGHVQTFTSACGPSIYRDDLLFPRARGVEHAFTCDPFHSLVQHSVLRDDGVSFSAQVDTESGKRDFIASEDRWFRPVMTRTGPDGALWIVDMYRYMIEHPDWLPPHGQAELRPFFRSGDDRGRIYRVLPAGKSARSVRRESREVAEIVKRLADPNGITRDLAHRQLVDLNTDASVSELESLSRIGSSPLARVHALCVLDGMKKLRPEVLAERLLDRDPRVVVQAIRISESFADSERVRSAVRRVVQHADDKVRLQAANSLGAWKHESTGELLSGLAIRDPRNPWMRAAILSSAVQHLKPFSRQLAQAPKEVVRSFAAPILAIAFATKNIQVGTSFVADF
ncbi:MAG: PVC-type heme-binding CxxCH protein, partial [Planctomycetota bacterium]